MQRRHPVSAYLRRSMLPAILEHAELFPPGMHLRDSKPGIFFTECSSAQASGAGSNS
jgi:hypothetical protein